jgi:hypothetical protein
VEIFNALEFSEAHTPKELAVSQILRFGDMSDEITGIPVICEFTPRPVDAPNLPPGVGQLLSAFPLKPQPPSRTSFRNISNRGVYHWLRLILRRRSNAILPPTITNPEPNNKAALGSGTGVTSTLNLK